MTNDRLEPDEDLLLGRLCQEIDLFDRDARPDAAELAGRYGASIEAVERCLAALAGLGSALEETDLGPTTAWSESLASTLPEDLDHRAAGVRIGGDTLATTGRRLARFRDQRQIGEGGMGIVLEATDPDLGRTVALKIIRGRGSSRVALARFLREARITGQLEHPNIVPVHELAATDEGEVYFAMKRVRGGSLADVLTEVDPTDDVARRKLLLDFLKVCDALAYAHSRGVVHRDLKPANIMIGAFGEVLVMDWGIAHVADADMPGGPTDSLVLEASDRTADGAILGTVLYMSPEQAAGRGQEVGPATDIYALGAVLHEILTRRVPLDDRSAGEILTRRARGEPIPSPTTAHPSAAVPRELEAVIVRAMAPRPADRYADVGALRDDIEAFLADRPLAAARYTLADRTVRWIRSHRHGLAAAALALAALVGGVVATAVVRNRREATARATRIDAAAAAFDAALDDWTAAEADDPFDQSFPQDYLDTRLAALLAMERALADHPEPPVAWLGAIADRMLEVQQRATETGDWALATLLAEAAHAWRVIDGDERRWRLDAVGEARRATETADRRRLEHVLERIRRAETTGDHERQGLRPGELSERARRLARVGGPALTIALGQRLDDPTAGPVERRFAIEALGRRGDVTTPDPSGRTVADRVREALATSDSPDELAAWIRAAARLERWAPGAMGDLAAELSRLAGAEDVTGAIEYAIARARFILRGIADAELARDPFERGEQIEELADWVAAAVRSGSHYRRRVVTLVLDRSSERTPAERSFLCDQLGLLSRPGEISSRVLRSLLDGLPGEWTPNLPPEGVDRTLWRARRQLSLSAARNLSRIGDRESVLLVIARHVSAPTDSTWRDSTTLPVMLCPIDALSGVSTAEEINRRGILRRLQNDPAGALADFDRAIAIEPTAFGPRFNRALGRIQRGDLGSAIEDLEHLLASHPEEEPAILEQRAIAWIGLGANDRARADLDRALEINPRAAAILPTRAFLRVHQGDAAGALDDLGRAIELTQGQASNFCERGMILADLDRLEEALADADRAIRIDPLQFRAYHLRAVVRQRLDDPEGALADANRCALLEPGSTSAICLRGRIHVQLGRLEAARADAELVLDIDPRSGRGHLLAGVVAVASGDPARARVAFDRAVELAPNSDAWFGRANFLRQEGDLPGALADVDRAVALAPGRARYHALRSRLLRDSGRIADALAAADLALELTPDDLDRLEVRANLRLRLGQPAGAIEDLDRVLATRPDRFEARRDRGVALSMSGDLDRALVDLDRAVELRPADPDARTARALARSSAGDAAGAIDDLTAVLEACPDRAEAWYLRALYRNRSDDAEGALADYTRAIEIEPNHSRSLINRAQLLMAAHDLEGARRDLRIATRVDPDRWQGWARLGVVEAAIGDRAAAGRAFDRAIEKAPARMKDRLRADRERLVAGG